MRTCPRRSCRAVALLVLRLAEAAGAAQYAACVLAKGAVRATMCTPCCPRCLSSFEEMSLAHRSIGRRQRTSRPGHSSLARRCMTTSRWRMCWSTSTGTLSSRCALQPCVTVAHKVCKLQGDLGPCSNAYAPQLLQEFCTAPSADADNVRQLRSRFLHSPDGLNCCRHGSCGVATPTAATPRSSRTRRLARRPRSCMTRPRSC